MRNFPIQSTAAEILHVACILAERRGIPIVATVHDALMAEADLDRVEEMDAALERVMRDASSVVLRGYELPTDKQIIRPGERYFDDKRCRNVEHGRAPTRQTGSEERMTEDLWIEGSRTTWTFSRQPARGRTAPSGATYRLPALVVQVGVSGRARQERACGRAVHLPIALIRRSRTVSGRQHGAY